MVRHLPNLLSALRLLAAPFTAWLILSGHDTVSLLVFAAAGLSDGLDGFIARRWGVTSGFGAWLDPAADKLLMLFCFTALYAVHIVPFWLVAIVVGRDLVFALAWGLIKLLGLGLTTPTLFVGKLSTAVQVVTILTLLLLLALDLDAPHLSLALAVACAFFTLLAAAGYATVMMRLAGKRVPQ
ncbi:MAG TPA: CDP-alcohol phosphatidyltransferase family protein [Rhizomicrobium sp.]|nr:CDP-alcohol phosphatidyltransferase family protein [Rhizomicrobium sp.]